MLNLIVEWLLTPTFSVAETRVSNEVPKFSLLVSKSTDKAVKINCLEEMLPQNFGLL